MGGAGRRGHSAPDVRETCGLATVSQGSHSVQSCRLTPTAHSGLFILHHQRAYNRPVLYWSQVDSLLGFKRKRLNRP